MRIICVVLYCSLRPNASLFSDNTAVGEETTFQWFVSPQTRVNLHSLEEANLFCLKTWGENVIAAY